LPVPPKHFYYIAPHRDDWTVCYNLFQRPSAPERLWFVIDAFKSAALKVWGIDNPKDTPLIDEWITNAFFTGIHLGLTLPDLGKLLEPGIERNALRMSVADRLPAEPSGIPAAWRQLCYLAEKRPVEFQTIVGPTMRRLADFLNKPRLRRIYGVPDISFDLAEAMDEGAIMLVDLSPGGRFSKGDAHFFGTMLLADFYLQMFQRARRERGFTLYIDEFQNFATKDLADMLDEARKFGLRLVLAHQRPGQLESSDEPSERNLFSAVMTNCRTKMVFGGIAPHELETVARALSMGMLDPDQIKRTISSRSVIDYVKEYWTAHSRGRSHGKSTATGSSSTSSSISGTGWASGSGTTYDAQGGFLGSDSLFTAQHEAWQRHFSDAQSSTDTYIDAEIDTESESETTFPVLVPVMEEQLSSVYYRTLDEQLYQFMAILHDQQQRHAMVRVVGQKEAVPIVVPFVAPVDPPAREIEHQLALSYGSTRCFLPVAKADEAVARHTEAFESMAIPVMKSQFGAPKPRRGIMIQSNDMQETSTEKAALKWPGIELQQRDIALFSGLFECRLMKIAHAALFHYDGSEAVADRRLRKLSKAGLLDRLEYKVSSGRPPAVYTLAKGGMDALVEAQVLTEEHRSQWDSKWRKRFKVESSTIEHELGVMDIKAALLPAIDAAPGRRVVEFLTWPEKIKFTAKRDGRSVTVKPDGYFCIHNEPEASHKQYDHLYLEFDRGKENQATLWEKYSDYRTHYRSGGFVEWLGYSKKEGADYGLRVLFVMLSSQRLQNFLDKHEQGIRESTQLWLTTLEQIRQDPLGEIWTIPSAYFAAGSLEETARRSLIETRPTPSTGAQASAMVQFISQQTVIQ
jgi:DNA-binding PadR family transcriptional regulator